MHKYEGVENNKKSTHITPHKCINSKGGSTSGCDSSLKGETSRGETVLLTLAKVLLSQRRGTVGCT